MKNKGRISRRNFFGTAAAAGTAFTLKPGAIYASSLGVLTAEVQIKSLAGEKIARMQLLGSDQKIEWQQTADALVIKPVSSWPCPHAVAFRIDLIQ